MVAHLQRYALPKSNLWGQLSFQWQKAQSTVAAGVAISHLTPTTGCGIFEERNGNKGLHL